MKITVFLLSLTFLLIIIACSEQDNGNSDNPATPGNHAPVIQSLTAYPNEIGRSGQSTITCIATDEDGDSLTYYWTCHAGSFIDRSGYEVTWQGTSQAGQYFVCITISDGKSVDSDSVSITIIDEPQNTPPSEPYDPDPPSGKTSVSRNTSLSWRCDDADGDSLVFDVYFGTNRELTSLISIWRDISEKNVQPAELGTYQCYYWKVVAKDTHGAESQGAVWNFITGQ